MNPISLGILQVTRRLLASALLVLNIDPQAMTVAGLIDLLRDVDQEPDHYIGIIDDLDSYMIHHD